MYLTFIYKNCTHNLLLKNFNLYIKRKPILHILSIETKVVSQNQLYYKFHQHLDHNIEAYWNRH